jgi:branched-chain amino acid transport system substrate-binding protein
MPVAKTKRQRALTCAFVALSLALGLLAGCSSTTGMFDTASPTPPAPADPVAPPPAVGGEVIGTGPVKVALIVPLTANGQPSAIGQSLQNAAQLAVEESGLDQITLTIQDDRSTPSGAAQAAQTALAGGADIVLGPLYSADVRQVSAAARSAGKPVIAFSSDASVASSGVYLLSFLIEGYVDRVMEYAASKGKKSFGVLAPQTDFGNVAVTEAQLEASRLNVQLAVVARYPAGQPAGGAQQIANVTQPVDALLVAEQAEGAGAVAMALSSKGFKGQILGTGLWNDPKALNSPGLSGAWIAAPENANFDRFAAKYKAKFNSDPARLATLSYDAVSLVSALARSPAPQRFTAAVLTNASGFNGADGLFRFLPDGRNERGLAVLQIGAGTTNVIAPAPRNFAGG